MVNAPFAKRPTIDHTPAEREGGPCSKTPRRYDTRPMKKFVEAAAMRGWSSLFRVPWFLGTVV
jgi:hypothetical protein